MSDETSEKAAIERKIRRAALFGVMYGQPRPDPVDPLSPYRAPTGAEAKDLSEEIDKWRAATKQFVASSTPLGLGERRGPKMQNLPVWRRSFPVYRSLVCFDGLPSEIKAADLVEPKPEGPDND